MHHPIIKPNHMQIPWHDPIRDQKELPVSQAPLPIRAGLVGRVGLLLLSCGTGAWRVRSSMNEIAEALGLVCAADIGLLSIEYTCSDGENTFAQTLTLTATGVNTAKLDQLERFVKRFPLDGVYMTADDLHTRLDEIAQAGGSYTPLQQGLASALACGGFTFLLGGGPIEMLLAFLGAGVGQYVRARLTQRHLTLFGCIALSVAAACLVYAGCSGWHRCSGPSTHSIRRGISARCCSSFRASRSSRAASTCPSRTCAPDLSGWPTRS